MPIAHWQARIALPTLHGKQALIAPILEPATGCQVVHVPEIDTDRFGSFTRLKPRIGSQLDAARAKAEAALAHSGLSLALASEGAFVSDPFAGLMPWNIELVLLLDRRHGQQIVGIAQGPAQAGQGWVDDAAALQRLAHELGFPQHQLCLRPEHTEDARVHQGLHTEAGLLEAFAQAQAASARGRVFVESDLRAHANPTRQDMIRRATQDLLQKMLCDCPSCQRPGFAITSHRPGRPCRACARPTPLALAQIWSCEVCGHREQRPLQDAVWASPSQCPHCNP